MTLERKKTLNVFRDARDAFGSYDDFPVGQPGIDPMPHLSRNRCAQPFWQVSEADQVLIQLAGRGAIEFRDQRMALEPGDTVYIPARTATRLVPHGEVVQLRLKVEPAVREIAAWYCACGEVVAQHEIPAGIAQGAYLAAVRDFNASTRTCPSCAAVHPVVELGDIAWDRVAAALA